MLRPSSRRTWSRLLIGSVTILLVSGLAVACASTPSPQGEASSDPTVRATLCFELNNPDTIEATRVAIGLDQMEIDQLVAACAASEFNQDIDDLLRSITSVPSTEPSPLTSSALSTLLQTFPITDDEGYSFDLAVDFQLRSVTADPTSQPPGVTAAAREIDLTMSLTNTTASRALTFKEVGGITSPLDLPTFLISAVYNEGNPVCVVGLQAKRGCEWPMAFGRMENGMSVPAGSTYTLKIGAVPNGAGYDATLLKGITETSWDDIYPSLTNPDGYKIVYSGGDGYRFTPACGGDTIAPPIVWSAPCLG